MAKIVSIVPYRFLPAKTGGQKFAALFYQYLSEFENILCISVRSNETSGTPYRVKNILSNSPSRYINIRYFFAIRNLLREEKATHLFIEHPYYGWLGMLLKKFCGITLVVHSHNIEGLRWKSLGKWWWRILLQYEKITHRYADLNIFITDADKNYAIQNFNLNPAVCITATYGTTLRAIPMEDERLAAKKDLQTKHRIPSTSSILLFNGIFEYVPNKDALEFLLHKVLPHFEEINKGLFSLIICGTGIPQEMILQYPQVIFAGFVPDIELYLRGADVFLNPITYGGGIKTKLVEALANNLTCVSTVHGAIGISPSICNGKLLIVEDGNAGAFAASIREATMLHHEIKEEFFEFFYWKNICRRVSEQLNG